MKNTSRLILLWQSVSVARWMQTADHHDYDTGAQKDCIQHLFAFHWLSLSNSPFRLFSQTRFSIAILPLYLLRALHSHQPCMCQGLFAAQGCVKIYSFWYTVAVVLIVHTEVHYAITICILWFLIEICMHALFRRSVFVADIFYMFSGGSFRVA